MIKKNRPELFRYMSGILQNKNCKNLQINGVEDHVHILMKLHPSVALADLIKDIKISTNAFIKEKGLFPLFTGWQNGYGAFTYSFEALPNLIRYIQNQEIHHGEITFEDEYIALLEEHGIEYDLKYVFD
jgi:REP element-mobilizing transposase RayT